jgi:quinol monooxygenase YgiN
VAHPSYLLAQEDNNIQDKDVQASHILVFGHKRCTNGRKLMETNASTVGPVLRLFEARAKPGSADKLAKKFETTSASVVRDEPGNKGYFFARSTADEGQTLLFASLWIDMDAVKARFGVNWKSSHLPDGYAELIDECSVRHFNLASGWHVVDMA